jgi:hypothetical protein
MADGTQVVGFHCPDGRAAGTPNQTSHNSACGTGMARILLWTTLLQLTLSFSVVSRGPLKPTVGKLAQQLKTTPQLNPRLFLAAHQDDDNPEAPISKTAGDDDSSPVPPGKSLRYRRFLDYFRRPNDGLSVQQKLAKYGLAAALSYGAVSNVGGCVCVSIAWFVFCKTYHVSPLEPGQLKSFLAVYAGFFVFLNVIRPLRFALSIAISPQFDRMINAFQRRFSISRTTAIALSVLLVNVFGSIAVLVTGVSLASLASGIPIFPIAAKPY